MEIKFMIPVMNKILIIKTLDAKDETTKFRRWGIKVSNKFAAYTWTR
jgi:hypothetical protein